MIFKRNISLILINIFLIQFSFAQEKKIEIDSEYFLLGTLSDYGGRLKQTNKEYKISSFHEHEKHIRQKLNYMLKKEYRDIEFRKFNNVTEMYSKKISDRIDNYYNYTFGNTTTSNDTTYRGKLKENIFKNDNQKLSFIMGAYVRYGATNGVFYWIQTYNTPNKVKLCENILNDLACTKVFQKNNKNTIPASYSVIFTPTEIMKEYFNEFYFLKR